MIRSCTNADVPTIEYVINQAAQKYRGVIPEDCWHDPYMSHSELLSEISSGVRFWGCEENNSLLAVMGLQDSNDVTLIRHAYVHPSHQGRGLGSQLLRHLSTQAKKPLLIGTWASAHWAIQFYEKHGFRIADADSTDLLLSRYWHISQRQKETSVVLVRGE